MFDSNSPASPAGASNPKPPKSPSAIPSLRPLSEATSMPTDGKQSRSWQPGGGDAPQNLPVGTPFTSERKDQPEDIFNMTDEIPLARAKEPASGVQKMTQNAASEPLAQPRVPQPQPVANVYRQNSSEIQMPQAPVAPSPMPPQIPAGQGSSKRKVLVFLLMAFIVALLIVAGYLGFRIVQVVKLKGLDVLNSPSSLTPEPQAIEPEVTDESGVDTTQPTDGGIPQTPPVPQDDVVAPPDNSEISPVVEPEPTEPSTDSQNGEVSVDADTDKDGLTDVRELELGSNPREADTDFDGIDDASEVNVYTSNPTAIDTDNDGLDDYSEVFMYGTSPIFTDTDSDGYTDGQEVQNGYNPKGPGKLP